MDKTNPLPVLHGPLKLSCFYRNRSTVVLPSENPSQPLKQTNKQASSRQKPQKEEISKSASATSKTNKQTNKITTGGKGLSSSKQTHLSQEEVYFKALLADPRVKRGEYRNYLNLAIVEAIDFLESRGEFWSQQN